MALLIPFIFIAVIAFAAIKKVNVYSSYSRGIKDAADFTLSVLPVLCAMFMMCEVFERSRLSDALSYALSPALEFLGVPKELAKLILIKPFSGSGSLTYLNKIIAEYGADSYISRCACVLYGSSETVFYISAVYFARCKGKKRIIPIIIILLSTFVTTIIACALCRIM